MLFKFINSIDFKDVKEQGRVLAKPINTAVNLLLLYSLNTTINLIKVFELHTNDRHILQNYVNKYKPISYTFALPIKHTRNSKPYQNELSEQKVYTYKLLYHIHEVNKCNNIRGYVESYPFLFFETANIITLKQTFDEIKGSRDAYCDIIKTSTYNLDNIIQGIDYNCYFYMSGPKQYTMILRQKYLTSIDNYFGNIPFYKHILGKYNIPIDQVTIINESQELASDDRFKNHHLKYKKGIYQSLTSFCIDDIHLELSKLLSNIK